MSPESKLPLICPWCKAPRPCECGYKLDSLPKPDWEIIEQVYPEKVPFCGGTDAALLNSDGDDPHTVYFRKKSSGKNPSKT